MEEVVLGELCALSGVVSFDGKVIKHYEKAPHLYTLLP